jgi:hypothetical protein
VLQQQHLALARLQHTACNQVFAELRPDKPSLLPLTNSIYISQQLSLHRLEWVALLLGTLRC